MTDIIKALQFHHRVQKLMSLFGMRTADLTTCKFLHPIDV